MKDKIETSSSEETLQAGVRFAQSLLQKTNIVAFFGDLGTGKTTFLKGMISALTGCSPDEITSPTFNYLHVYPGTLPVYHFDLYRLASGEQFQAAGFSEYLQEEGVCCLEWAERIADRLPAGAIRVTLQHHGQNRRLIVIERPL